jgi:8-oxo-dGTP pyrophosphatase MutT (NUDIX family)
MDGSKEEFFEVSNLKIPLPDKYSQVFRHISNLYRKTQTLSNPEGPIKEMTESETNPPHFFEQAQFFDIGEDNLGHLDLILNFQLVASTPKDLGTYVHSVDLKEDLVDFDNYTNQFVGHLSTANDNGSQDRENPSKHCIDATKPADECTNIFSAIPTVSSYTLALGCDKTNNDLGHSFCQNPKKNAARSSLFQNNQSSWESSSIINNSHFTHSQLPNTIYPYDTALLPYNSQGLSQSSSQKAKLEVIHPNDIQSQFAKMCPEHIELYPRYEIPSPQKQVSMFRIDLVRIIEAIITALNFIDVERVGKYVHEFSQDNFDVNHGNGNGNGKSAHQIHCEKIMQNILIILRNTIYGLSINAPYLYYSKQLDNIPQICLKLNNMSGCIEFGKHEFSPPPDVNSSPTQPNKTNVPSSCSTLIMSSINNSHLCYPLNGTSTVDDDNNPSSNAPNSVLRHTSSIREENVSLPTSLSFHTEQNHWGMVIIVYENVDSIDLNDDQTSNNNPQESCQFGCQVDPSVLAKLQIGNNSLASKLGVYMLCIRPYKMIPPHYHTILDEVELNLSHSVSREHSVVMKTLAGRGDKPVESEDKMNGYGFHRSTWGMTNSWTDTFDCNSAAPGARNNCSQCCLPHRENHVHTYNNFTPFWTSVYCMSKPSFIPGDEIILGTSLHKEFLRNEEKKLLNEKNQKSLPNYSLFNRNWVDSSKFQENIKFYEKLPLHPLFVDNPWLGDNFWGNYTQCMLGSNPQTTLHFYKFPGCFEKLHQQITFAPIFPQHQCIYNTSVSSDNDSIGHLDSAFNPSLNSKIDTDARYPLKTNSNWISLFEDRKCADAILAFTIVLGKDQSSVSYRRFIKMLSPTSGDQNMSTYEQVNNKSDNGFYEHPPLLLFTQHESRGIELPGGKIDKDDYLGHGLAQDTIRNVEMRAVVRELKEETGLDLEAIANKKGQNEDNQTKLRAIENFIIPFGRYMIDENVLDKTTGELKQNKSLKDIFIVVLSYDDVSLGQNGNISGFTTQNSPAFECKDPFFRPILDIIPSLDFIHCNKVEIETRNRYSHLTHRVLDFSCAPILNQETLSPLLQDQCFTLVLRRLQGLISQIG